jgi:hypothetical protein
LPWTQTGLSFRRLHFWRMAAASSGDMAVQMYTA